MSVSSQPSTALPNSVWNISIQGDTTLGLATGRAETVPAGDAAGVVLT
jgi:hypothetical protein